MKPQTLFFSGLFAVIGAFFLFAVTPSAQATEKNAAHPAAAFIQKLGEEALVSLTDKSTARSVRETRTRKLLNDYFDVNSIGRFALAAYWKSASEAQKAEYFSLFEKMIVDTYTTRFEEYSGQSFKVDGARDTDNKRDAIVSSRILQKDGPDVNIEWRVRSKDGGMKVIDVIVENISMSVTQRSDFAAVIQRGGGDVEALLKSLRSKKKNASDVAKK